MDSKASPWLKCCYRFNLRVQLAAMQDSREGWFPMPCVQVSAVTSFFLRGFDRHAIFGFATAHPCFKNCQAVTQLACCIARRLRVRAIHCLCLRLDTQMLDG